MRAGPALRRIALVGLIAGCNTTVKEPAWFCGSSAVSMDGTPTNGEVPVTATLTQKDAEPADVSLGWSADGSSWHVASVLGQTTALPSGPDGPTSPLTWQSGLDLGAGSTDGLSLRLVAHSPCGMWEADPLSDLTVDNGEAGGSVCAVSVDTPASPEDGKVVVTYTLSHPESLLTYVVARYSTDFGGSWHTMTLNAEDCDGDGANDGLTNLSTSPEGVAHCLSWDSQSDFAADKQITVQLACGVGFAEEASGASDTFDVDNDPTPDPGELIISELLPTSSMPSGAYVELYNRTDHALNLNGTELDRWKAGANPDTTAASKSFTLSDPTETLLIDPGGTLLLAQTVDEAENGCLNPDLVWGSDFSLLSNSVLRLMLGDSDLAELSFLTADGWTFEEGVAKGIDPRAVGSDSWATLTNWCAQTSHIAACDAYTAAQTDLGTPGASNDRCP